MTIEQQSEAILKAVQNNLAAMFNGSNVRVVDTMEEVAVWLAKADAASDPLLAKGYRELAAELRGEEEDE